MNTLNNKAANFLEARRAVKKTLLLCLLFLLGIIALPVQGQTTPTATPVPPTATPVPPTATPIPPTQVADPTNLAGCGLPAGASEFTSASSITTFNMTEDCTYERWAVAIPNALMAFTSGRFTINGNGHTISGPSNTTVFYVAGANTVLNLNNIAFSNSGERNFPVINIATGATLNGQNLIFRETRNPATRTKLWVSNSRANLRNVQFLNNIQTSTGTNVGSAITAFNTGDVTTLSITNGIFRGNRNSIHTGTGNSHAGVITILRTGTTLTLNGCMTFDSNVQADGSTAALDVANISAGGLGTVNDRRTGLCPAGGFVFPQYPQPKKSKETATPWPSATSRPLATTCIDLNQATGIVVHATYGLASGVQCQRLDGGGIGVQAIVDGGFIDAVDIWGYAEQGVEVCFPQAGNLLFLDARMMPRTVAPLASQIVNGMTCGAIETPGSIVLMPLP